MPYSFHREMLEQRRIRRVVTETAITDGFGNRIPV